MTDHDDDLAAAMALLLKRAEAAEAELEDIPTRPTEGQYEAQVRARVIAEQRARRAEADRDVYKDSIHKLTREVDKLIFKLTHCQEAIRALREQSKQRQGK